MKARIINAADLKENDYGATRVTDIVTEQEWPFFSLAKIQKVGDDIRTGLDLESNTIYYVLEGSGTSVVDGQEFKVKKGDCILIPKGTKYRNLKGLTLLAISVPLFDRKKRVYVE